MRRKLVGWTCAEREEGAVEDGQSFAVYGGDGGLEVQSSKHDLGTESAGLYLSRGIVSRFCTRTLRALDRCGSAERSGMGTGGSGSLDRGADLGLAAPDVPSLPFLFPCRTEATGPPLLLDELAPSVGLDLPRLVWTDCSAAVPADLVPFRSPSGLLLLSDTGSFTGCLPKIPARTSGSEGPAPLEAARRCCGQKPIPGDVRWGVAMARATRWRRLERHSMDRLATARPQIRFKS